MMPIKIVIADDDSGMRLVMRKIISKVSDYQLAGEAENGRELLELVETQQPQVVLMDVEMPEMSGVECARIIGYQSAHRAHLCHCPRGVHG